MPSFQVARAAKDAVKFHAGFAAKLEGFAELSVAHAGGKIDERFGGDAGGFVEADQWLLSCCKPFVRRSDFVPSTNFMFTGTSTLRTSTP